MSRNDASNSSSIARRTGCAFALRTPMRSRSPSARKRVRRMESRAERRTLGVHELERGDVVLLGVGGEQDRRGAVHAQRVAREELRVVVVEPEWTRAAERKATVVLGDE